MALLHVLIAVVCEETFFKAIMSFRKRKVKDTDRKTPAYSSQLQLQKALYREEILRDRVKMLESESETLRLLLAPSQEILQ